MEKDAIFLQRREMKKKCHGIVKSHYIVLVFLSLVLILFGTEYNYTTALLGKNSGLLSPSLTVTKKDENGEDVSSHRLGMNVTELYMDFLGGKLTRSSEPAIELSGRLKKNMQVLQPDEVTDGVLGTVVNAVGSGRLLSGITWTLGGILRSEKAAAVVISVLTLLGYLLIFMFLKNVYSAALCRVFLASRIYKRVQFLEIGYILRVKRWIKASWTMMVMYTFQLLWSLTIVGGVIKFYSYQCVSYIVAENPDVGALQAITLSRRMMDGHKWEMFKYQLSLIGWFLLGVVTFGFSDMFYGVSYRIACETEFYVKVREDAIRRGVEGIEVLNDRWLFEKADRISLYEAYFDVVDEITILHEERMELTGARKIAAEWFGLWLGRLEDKKKYDDLEGRRASIENYKAAMQGEMYPYWLNPRFKDARKIGKQGHFSFIRSYSVWTLILFFVIFSFVGWGWEVLVHLMQTGEFANRGTLHGPWLPIYGTGGLIALMLCSRFRRKPLVEFIVATILCGTIEYFAAWMLETIYHQRWWSYDGYFLNLHGRICAEGLLVFGVACCAVVYGIAPVLDYFLSRISKKLLIGISTALIVIYAVDFVYSSANPNTGEGATEAVKPAAAAEAEETEAETEMEAEKEAEEEKEAEANTEAEADTETETET